MRVNLPIRTAPLANLTLQTFLFPEFGFVGFNVNDFKTIPFMIIQKSPSAEYNFSVKYE